MALLDQAKAVRVVLQAAGQKDVEVPEVRPRLVLEPREGERAPELQADVAVASHDGEARQLVAAPVQGSGGRQFPLVGAARRAERRDDREERSRESPLVRGRHRALERGEGAGDALNKGMPSPPWKPPSQHVYGQGSQGNLQVGARSTSGKAAYTSTLLRFARASASLGARNAELEV